MKLLITGAWNDGKNYIDEIKAMGHEVVFMQYEKDALPCEYEWVEGVICNGLFLSHPIEKFPNIGAENDKPSTKPVVIGNDCLLGEECVILKGSTVGYKCIVGVHSVVAGVSIPAETMAVGNPAVVKNLDTRTE